MVGVSKSTRTVYIKGVKSNNAFKLTEVGRAHESEGCKSKMYGPSVRFGNVKLIDALKIPKGKYAAEWNDKENTIKFSYN